MCAIAAQSVQALSAEATGGNESEWYVDEVREHRFDDGMFAADDVSIDGRKIGIGEECLISPDWEQCVRIVRVLDPAHDQAGGDLVASRERGLLGIGIGDPHTGVGIGHHTGIVHRHPVRWRRCWRSPE
ncbi:hypothetical protein P3H15_39445 [Rhodococcus sp. T2V]|uniref:hypothetical protein n=1 Tax=Rhodococcus sp. T2V TaxID=3034164 RepID=UPI0023E13979|nr:hypothetical protein [Rhodococcus sp. T2V]MDF3311076.1 hypothetical protein [Rhodococcus sp. T2V]